MYICLSIELSVDYSQQSQSCYHRATMNPLLLLVPRMDLADLLTYAKEWRGCSQHLHQHRHRRSYNGSMSLHDADGNDDGIEYGCYGCCCYPYYCHYFVLSGAAHSSLIKRHVHFCPLYQQQHMRYYGDNYCMDQSY